MEAYVRRMRRWRALGVEVFSACALGALTLSALVKLGGRSLLPEWLGAFLGPALLLAILTLGILSAGVWYHLFLVARAGGIGYAIAHATLSILLTPFFYVGVLLVPLLVQSDMETGVADWRRRREKTWFESLVGSVSGILALWAGAWIGAQITVEFHALWGLFIGTLTALLALAFLNRVGRLR